jgi:hypothetical protein
MANQDSPTPHKQDEQQGFPIQLKILLAVLTLSVLGLILKAAGVF